MQEEWGRVLPSLILSPMIVEDGRLLLISNLDLKSTVAHASHALAGGGRPRGLERPPSPARRQPRTENGLRLQGSKVTEINDGTGVGIYSLYGLRVLQALPDGEGVPGLATAVRMNATFPMVSPAVNLPTDPPRRVVNAGYFDNYGIQVATSWLHFQPRVAALQHFGRPASADPRRPQRVGPIRGGRPAARLLRLPHAGLRIHQEPDRGGGPAHTTTGMFRNDAYIEHLSSWFSGRTGCHDFFTTIVFENPAGISDTIDSNNPQNLPGNPFFGDDESGQAGGP